MKYRNNKRGFTRYALVLAALMILGLLAACQSGSTAPTEAPAGDTAAVTEQASEEPTVAPTEVAAEEIDAQETDAEQPTDEAANVAEETTATAVEAATAVPDEAAAAEGASVADPQTFSIVQAGTEARFIINEVLMGNDKTVVGVTSDVSGEIQLDAADPSASEIGVITINARDLTTDEDKRNGALRRLILQSGQDEYQYITFTPTSIDGLPDSVAVGETFSFQVTGDLQIRDMVQPVTFDVEVTADSESEISGLAIAEVQRADFGLRIPQVPGVAGVEENVRLELEFSAAAQ